MNSSVACCNNTSCPWCYNASTKQSSCLVDSHWCQHIFGMSWFPSFQFSFYMYASTFLTFSSRKAWVAGSHEHSFVCHNDSLVQKGFFQCWLMWSKYETKSTVLNCCWLTPVDCHRCLHVCSLLLECCHQACTSLLSFLSYCKRHLRDYGEESFCRLEFAATQTRSHVRHCWAVDISSATSVQLDTVGGRVGVRLLRPTTGQTPVDCLHRCLRVCSLLLESCHQACTSLLSFLSYCNLIQGNSLWCKIILPVRSAAWSTFQIKLHRTALISGCSLLPPREVS